MHNAALVVNGADGLGNFWSARRGDTLLYRHPFGALDFANSLRLSRGENCVPTEVAVWGLLEDVELGGARETKAILLASRRILAWPRGEPLWLALAGQSSSFRGYALRLGNAAARTGCVHLAAARFLTRSELHCRWEGEEVEVGDALRARCEAGQAGAVVRECLRSANGTVWSAPRRACQPLRAPGNRGVLWVTVSVSGLHWERKEQALPAVREALRGELGVAPGAVEVFFEYTRHGTGLVLYKEFYIRVAVAAVRAGRLCGLLREHAALLAAQITAKLNHEVVVKLRDLECVVDRRLMIALMIALPAVAVVLVAGAAWMLWRRRRREIQERMLLLA